MPSTWHGRTWPWERTGESLTAGKVTLEKRRTKLWSWVSPRAYGSVQSIQITLPELAMSSIPSHGSLAPHLAILGQGFPFLPGWSGCTSPHLPPNSRPGHGLLWGTRTKPNPNNHRCDLFLWNQTQPVLTCGVRSCCPTELTMTTRAVKQKPRQVAVKLSAAPQLPALHRFLKSSCKVAAKPGQTLSHMYLCLWISALNAIPSLQLVVKLWILTLGYLQNKNKETAISTAPPVQLCTLWHQKPEQGDIKSLFLQNRVKKSQHITIYIHGLSEWCVYHPTLS